MGFLALNSVSSVSNRSASMVWIISAPSGIIGAMSLNALKYAALYGLPLAALVFVLQWIEYRYLVFSMPGEIYIGIIAAIFIALGIWTGMRLTAAPASGEFVPNDKAIESLGLTKRECEILAHLAKGESNKEIARSLGVSPNTIKTHVASLFAKLEVTGRGKAVEAARGLSLIP